VKAARFNTVAGTTMKNTLTVVAALAIGGCAASPAASTPQPRATIISNATLALGRNLVAIHATLDGAPVTGLRQTARCEAVIATARGPVAIRWKDLDGISHLDHGRVVYGVTAGGRRHVLLVRDGPAGDDIGAGLTLLHDECGGA
jgi:hypothetical protein